MMKSFTRTNAIRFGIAFFLAVGTMTGNVFGQNPTKPYMQDIPLPSGNTNNPTPGATPLITKTVSVSPAYPIINDVSVPGYSGILVETLDGKTVVDSNSNFAFNPASNVKIATAYSVLKTFGPNFRFQTSFWTDGQIDPTTRTLNGNLYVSGRDPMFNLEHAVNIAYELNRLGISSISGSMVVTENFALNYNMSPVASANTLANTLDAGKRSSAANKAWQNYLTNSGKYGKITLIPSVSIGGKVFVQPMAGNLRQLFTHESAPLREIVKVTMCYSNNFLAERLGEMVGGPYRVAQIAQQGGGFSPAEMILQTSSGLGINRVTPHAMMRLLRAFRAELGKNKMTFADIMPVAGVDKGTLEGRFDSDFARGSVVGKTGTLGNTDSGVSALSGEIHTRNGILLFIIFNQKGSVPRFRAFQNNYVSLIQGQFGGAAQMAYTPISLDVRLTNTRFTYPDMRQRIN